MYFSGIHQPILRMICFQVGIGQKKYLYFEGMYLVQVGLMLGWHHRSLTYYRV